MSEQGPKSAFEIAMERLRQKDKEEGVEHQPRTSEQKAAIAEIRSLYEAKLAQIEVMHSSAVATAMDPAARAVLEQNHQRDRERLANERDTKIERARRADT